MMTATIRHPDNGEEWTLNKEELEAMFRTDAHARGLYADLEGHVDAVWQHGEFRHYRSLTPGCKSTGTAQALVRSTDVLNKLPIGHRECATLAMRLFDENIRSLSRQRQGEVRGRIIRAGEELDIVSQGINNKIADLQEDLIRALPAEHSRIEEDIARLHQEINKLEQQRLALYVALVFYPSQLNPDVPPTKELVAQAAERAHTAMQDYLEEQIQADANIITKAQRAFERLRKKENSKDISSADRAYAGDVGNLLFSGLLVAHARGGSFGFCEQHALAHKKDTLADALISRIVGDEGQMSYYNSLIADFGLDLNVAGGSVVRGSGASSVASGARGSNPGNPVVPDGSELFEDDDQIDGDQSDVEDAVLTPIEPD